MMASDEFVVQPTDAGLASVGAIRGMEAQARVAERMDGQPYDVELEEGRDCLMCEGTGYSDKKTLQRACPHCHGRGWLKATSYEPNPLFTIREVVMRQRGGTAWGVRHRDGWWHWQRFGTQERAEARRDLMLVDWLEGCEEVLVEGFDRLIDAE
jgi:hypothetical protein